MISQLKGKIDFKTEKFLIVDVNGLGYKVFCSPNTFKKLPGVGERICLFTFLYSREDTIELYGFLNHQELELFETLNDISGIGPKTAMLLASLGSLEKLKEALEKEKIPFEIKGIGKKKMQKILLELTGKIKEISKKEFPQKDEALEALVGLGFPHQKAKAVLSRLPDEIKDTETKIKEALKILGK